MTTAFLVRTRDGNPFFSVTVSESGSQFKPLTENAKEIVGAFADEYADAPIPKAELEVSLDRGMTVEGPMPASALPSAIKKQVSAPSPATKQPQKSIVSDAPISVFSTTDAKAIIAYKASAFVAERTKTTFNYEVKRVRAMWDPSLSIPGTNRRGGWRCPTGTRYGGQITDRFGRNCGWGVARRIANAITNIGERMESIDDRRRGRRVNRRNERMIARLQNNERAGRVERGLRGIADRLEGDNQNQRTPAVQQRRPQAPRRQPQVRQQEQDLGSQPIDERPTGLGNGRPQNRQQPVERQPADVLQRRRRRPGAMTAELENERDRFLRDSERRRVRREIEEPGAPRTDEEQPARRPRAQRRRRQEASDARAERTATRRPNADDQPDAGKQPAKPKKRVKPRADKPDFEANGWRAIGDGKWRKGGLDIEVVPNENGGYGGLLATRRATGERFEQLAASGVDPNEHLEAFQEAVRVMAPDLSDDTSGNNNDGIPSPPTWNPDADKRNARKFGLPEGKKIPEDGLKRDVLDRFINENFDAEGEGWQRPAVLREIIDTGEKELQNEISEFRNNARRVFPRERGRDALGIVMEGKRELETRRNRAKADLDDEIGRLKRAVEQNDVLAKRNGIISVAQKNNELRQINARIAVFDERIEEIQKALANQAVNANLAGGRNNRIVMPEGGFSAEQLRNIVDSLEIGEEMKRDLNQAIDRENDIILRAETDISRFIENAANDALIRAYLEQEKRGLEHLELALERKLGTLNALIGNGGDMNNVITRRSMRELIQANRNYSARVLGIRLLEEHLSGNGQNRAADRNPQQGARIADNDVDAAFRRFQEAGFPEQAFWRDPEYPAGEEQGRLEEQFGQYFGEDRRRNERGQRLAERVEERRAAVMRQENARQEEQQRRDAVRQNIKPDAINKKASTKRLALPDGVEADITKKIESIEDPIRRASLVNAWDLFKGDAERQVVAANLANTRVAMRNGLLSPQEQAAYRARGSSSRFQTLDEARALLAEKQRELSALVKSNNAIRELGSARGGKVGALLTEIASLDNAVENWDQDSVVFARMANAPDADSGNIDNFFNPDSSSAIESREKLGDLGEQINKEINDAIDKRQSILADYLDERYKTAESRVWLDMTPQKWRSLNSQQKKDYLLQAYSHPIVKGMNGKFYRFDARVGITGRDSIGVAIDIHEVDQNGNILRRDIGDSTRGINIADGTVKNNTFFIRNKADRGAGLQTVYNQHAFMFLKQIGIKKATVGAVDDGPFVWARIGFKEDGSMGGMENTVSAALKYYEKYGSGGLISTPEEYWRLRYLLEKRQRGQRVTRQEVIFAVASSTGDKNERFMREETVKQWIKSNHPDFSGTLDFGEQKISPTPRGARRPSERRRTAQQRKQ